MGVITAPDYPHLVPTSRNNLLITVVQWVMTTKPLPFDPNFPDRPQTTDFAALSEVVCNHDSMADEGMSLVDVYKNAGFDLDSVIYMATQRAKRVVEMLGTNPPKGYADLVGTMGSLWADAFVAGLAVGERRAEDAAQQIDGSRRQGNG